MENLNLNQEYSILEAMNLALVLAEKGIGFVEPNPPVGCIILNSENRLIGYGYHELFGGLHAETQALQSVVNKDELINATVVVTLEPCGHKGKTPPCSGALIEAGVGKVIYGVSDENPLFNHKGIIDLEKNNIVVEKYKGVLEVRLAELVDKFKHNQKEILPYISLKFASSLDGKIALDNGESKWLTGEESRNYTHRLRSSHESILIGVNTLLIDNPSLNIRLGNQSKPRKNKVIILDPNFRSKDFLDSSKLVEKNTAENIFIVCESKFVSKELKYNFIPLVKLKNGQIDLAAVARELKKLNINSIFVEGGASTISGFLSQGLFDKIYNFIASSILGSQHGISWAKDLKVESLSNKIILNRVEVRCFGADILMTFKPDLSR